jgi:alkylated DNA repair dioxygenase AlkB
VTPHQLTMQHNVAKIAGLILIPAFLDTTEHDALAAWIAKRPWSTTAGRQIQHYGFRYAYDRRPIGHDDFLSALPPQLEHLGRYLGGNLHEQASVTAYDGGTGLDVHIEHAASFGPIVASICLGHPCQLVFGLATDIRAITVNPGDVIFLTDDARYRWTLTITPQPTRRIWLTFRSIAERELVHRCYGSFGQPTLALYQTTRTLEEREALRAMLVVGKGSPANGADDRDKAKMALAVQRAIARATEIVKTRRGRPQLMQQASGMRFCGIVEFIEDDRIAVVIDVTGNIALYDVTRARAGAFAPGSSICVQRTTGGDLLVEPDRPFTAPTSRQP